MDILPNEIIINILGYLSTYDLIQFCNAYQNSCYLQEKNLIRFIDFSRRFELHSCQLYKLVTTDLNYTYIKFLNINSLYWISSQHLRRIIRKLENLEVLYAIDTKLGVKDKDIAEYTKLKKLSVSVEDNQFDHSTVVASQNLKFLKSLCLRITQREKEYNGIYLFFRELKQLEELWIYDDGESSYRINYGQIAIVLKNLKKLVIKSKVVLPYYDFRYNGLFKIFECKRFESAMDIIFEKILIRPKGSKRSIFEPKENAVEKSWEIFESLHKDIPCGPKESKELYFRTNIKDIYFEDLNFCHTVILCNEKYIKAALQILSAKNSTKLKRLAFRSCLFQNLQTRISDEPSSSFKRTRCGVQINSSNHPFESIAGNLKNLSELEVLTCPGCRGGVVMSAYPLIGIFQNLLKLTIEVPHLLDGSFLNEVFTKCQYLQSVNLICVAQNETFMNNLCLNLKLAKQLRDFRLVHKEIVIDKLLKSFCEIESRKLLRVFIDCDNLRYSGLNSSQTQQHFYEFMENNPQVIFFLLLISKNTIKQNSDIQKILHRFREGNTAKILWVKKDISSFRGGFPIPTAHHDMMFNYTNVSVINLDDF